MEDIACHDLMQAEQYISLIALHALTFPQGEGFAVGGTSAASSQTFFRLLPAVFRDLWDELEEQRRLRDDATNRAVWAKLRAILESKMTEPAVRSQLLRHVTDLHLLRFHTSGNRPNTGLYPTVEGKATAAGKSTK